jgi:hypothetical protein
MGDARIVSAETEIRQALSTKGERYGELDAPYLIVVLLAETVWDASEARRCCHWSWAYTVLCSCVPPRCARVPAPEFLNGLAAVSLTADD